MNKKIETGKAPSAIGPYSQGIVNGNMIFVSGQIPLVPETGAFVSDDIKEQTKQSLTNIKNILEAEGLKMSNIVKTTVMLSDIKDFQDMNEVYATFFEEPYPARSACQVAALPKGVKVEIEVIAMK